MASGAIGVGTADSPRRRGRDGSASATRSASLPAVLTITIRLGYTMTDWDV